MFINKYEFIKDPEIKEALAKVRKLRSQFMHGLGILDPKQYRKKYLEDLLYGQDKNSRKDVKSTRPERRVGFALKGLGLRVWREYKVIGHYYDFYIVDRNILVEVDGEFWHPESFDVAKYKSQKKNFFNDKVKNAIASAKGIPLIRIREDQINELDGDGLREELNRLITEADQKRSQQATEDE